MEVRKSAEDYLEAILMIKEKQGYVRSVDIAEHLGIKELNPDFTPLRTPAVRVNDLSFEERAQLVKKNPTYGKIICRCSGITEGEVLDAVRRGAYTIDAVKRRAGTGLGRCQGSVCTEKIMKLISRETGIKMCDITKDGLGTRIIGGSGDDTN